MEEQKQTTFEGLALVEIMGHRRAAGHVTTEYIGTAAFLRIVTPEVPPTEYTLERDTWIGGQFLCAGSVLRSSRERAEVLVGAGSVYAITPIKEEDLLSMASLRHEVITTVGRQSLPAALPADGEKSDEVPY
jgi:hypothetical protein